MYIYIYELYEVIWIVHNIIYIYACIYIYMYNIYIYYIYMCKALRNILTHCKTLCNYVNPGSPRRGKRTKSLGIIWND